MRTNHASAKLLLSGMPAILAATLAACSSGTEPSAAPIVPPKIEAPSDAPPPSPPDPCEQLTMRFEEILAKGRPGCASDEGCGVYQAGVGHNCGGITDRATANQLAGITEEFFARKCGYVINCAPRAMFRPVCVNGFCVDGGGPGTFIRQ
jgi:hypothetical protein